jgi:hypothetical protein
MTKSGYFRYAFAKELGYPETEARDIAMFRSPTLLRKRAGGERMRASPRTARGMSGPTVLSAKARRAAVTAEKARSLGQRRARFR